MHFIVLKYSYLFKTPTTHTFSNDYFKSTNRNCRSPSGALRNRDPYFISGLCHSIWKFLINLQETINSQSNSNNPSSSNSNPYLAIKISISSSANRLPIHILGPKPKGKNENGCWFFSSVQTSIFKNRSGMYSSGFLKFCGCLVMMYSDNRYTIPWVFGTLRRQCPRSISAKFPSVVPLSYKLLGRADSSWILQLVSNPCWVISLEFLVVKYVALLLSWPGNTTGWVWYLSST